MDLPLVLRYHDPMDYPDALSHRHRLESDGILPEGFSTATTSLRFLPVENPELGEKVMNLSLIRLDKPSDSFAGQFTRNIFPGWPVLIGRELMHRPQVQGILVNNSIANVAVPDGQEASLHLTHTMAKIMGDKAPYIPSSTGVIGWSLPVEAIEEKLPALSDNINKKSLLPIAESIMTTDAWPKLRRRKCGEGSVLGTAKGAGMIEPHMATMLSFILTDVAVSRTTIRRILADVVKETYNRISVDGEMSTSDTVLMLSSGCRPYPGDTIFRKAVYETAQALSEDVVRNGEGTAHVFCVNIIGAPHQENAVFLARSIANAPLIKTMIRGNDPNVGRLLQALGAACARQDLTLNPHQVRLEIGTQTIYDKGHFLLDRVKESFLSAYLTERELPLPSYTWPLHEKNVTITIHLGEGKGAASMIASDLSEQYIRINSSYRT